MLFLSNEDEISMTFRQIKQCDDERGYFQSHKIIYVI